MKFVCIDIETTGLNPDACQVIQFAAVLDDWSQPRPLATYTADIAHRSYDFEPTALAMHAAKAERIAAAKLSLRTVIDQFCGLLVHHGYVNRDGVPRIVVAGKNYFAFDHRFLQQSFDAAQIRVVRRALDPGPLYAEVGDAEPPTLAECCRRAGVPFQERHVALADALAVCRLLRKAKGLAWEFEA